MILADYFRSQHDAIWDIAARCGVIRLPEHFREPFHNNAYIAGGEK